MLLRMMVALGLVLVAATPIAAQQCNVPGYAVQVTAADGATLDDAFLDEMARTVALRWATPSVRRADFLMWRRVRERTLPDIPRWADDWRPDSTHVAAVTLILRRRGRADISDPSPTSGDRMFDRSLESIVRDPLPGSPEWPSLPASVTADSIALHVVFGAKSDAPVPGVIRFAGDQTPVMVSANSLSITFTPRATSTLGGRSTSAPSSAGIAATVKYDVTTNGTVDPRSIQIVEATDRDFGRAVQDALLRARFTVATTNCQPVRISVLQRFGT